jgi:predicted aspartyl protease
MAAVGAAALLLGLDAVRSGPPEPMVELPVDLVGGDVQVPVSVPGSAPVPFILDTGAGATILDWHLADSLGLDPRATGSTGGAGPGQLRFGRSEGGELRLGSIRIGSDPPLVMPLDSVLAPWCGCRTGGVIGFPFFRDHVVDLDFADGRVRIWSSDAVLDLPEANRVPLRVERPWARVDAELFFPGLGGHGAELVVDLGAPDPLYLTTRWVRSERALDRLAAPLEVSRGAGVGGEARFRMTRADSLTAGPLTVRRPIALLSEDAALDLDTDGILGMAVLRRFRRVVLDYPREQMLLILRRQDVEVPDFNLSGLVLWAPGAWSRGDTAAVRVREVWDGSPAARAGLRAGDRILAVGGDAVEAASLDRARRALRSMPGDTVSLTVEREGTVSRVELVLQRLL